MVTALVGSRGVLDVGVGMVAHRTALRIDRE